MTSSVHENSKLRTCCAKTRASDNHLPVQNLLVMSAECRPIKQSNKQTSKPDSNTDHYQSWMLPMADAKITLDTGSVMRISCPGFGFQHGDLSASQFWTTKYVISPKTQFQKSSLFTTLKIGSSIITSKSLSKNFSNENKHRCFCCLQDKTWIKMPIL